MQPITVKIKKPDNGQNSAPPANLLNLNEPPAPRSAWHRVKKYLWLAALVLILVESGVLAWFYFGRPVLPYYQFLPENPTAVAYLDLSSAGKLAISLKTASPDWPPASWGDKTWQELLNQTKLGSAADLLKLFQDKITLAAVSTAENQPPSWLLVGKLRVTPEAFSQAQATAEKNLKLNYNLVAESYRQIKITQVNALNSNQNNLFYAQANNFFVLANSDSLLKATLDKIIAQ